MALHVILGKPHWEHELRHQCQHHRTIVIQPPAGEGSQLLADKAEAILKSESYVRCDDRGEDLWHNNLVTYRRESNAEG